MSNFAFLQPEWKQIHEAAEKAEASAIQDRTACLCARQYSGYS